MVVVFDVFDGQSGVHVEEDVEGKVLVLVALELFQLGRLTHPAAQHALHPGHAALTHLVTLLFDLRNA